MSEAPEGQDALWEQAIDESSSPAEMFAKAEELGLVQTGELGQITDPDR